MINTSTARKNSLRMSSSMEKSPEINSQTKVRQSQTSQRSARKCLSLKRIAAEKKTTKVLNNSSIKNQILKKAHDSSIQVNDLDDSCFDESDFQAIDELMSSGNTRTSQNIATLDSNLNPSKKQRKSTDDSGIAETSIGSPTVLDSSQISLTSIPAVTQIQSQEDTSQITSNIKSVLLSNAQAPSNILFEKQRSKVLEKMMDMNETAIMNESLNLDESIMNSSITSTKINDTSFYGLPSKVQQLVHDFKGIEDLYSWQKECLNLEAVQQKKNLIYSLPTSGGKTLVAEILILREILCQKKNAIFIFPYVSIVQEKVRSLSPFSLALNFLVEEYAGGKGSYPPRKRRWKNVVYVATIEKALGLVNSLVETDRLKELGLVVVDELHMLGDGSRGASLESLLTRLMYTKMPIQVIGMSATIGNLSDLSQFLNAETYTQDFRPVELKEYIKLDNKIYQIQQGSEEMFFPVRSLPMPRGKEKNIDPNQIGRLVREVVPNNSCLVFCATKKNCENVAIMLLYAMDKEVYNHRHPERKALYHALLVEGNGSICPTLKKTLPYGIAYHHSGLTMNERNLLEEGYRAGILSCLCCTSTLAAGVNLPAKRVILREPKIAAEYLTLSVYKQMVGRAGRAGHDSIGESILICNHNDLPKVRAFLSSGMNQCISHLYVPGGNSILEQLIVSSVGLGQTNTPGEIKQMIQGSLLKVQAQTLNTDLNEVIDEIIRLLMEAEVLSENTENDKPVILTSESTPKDKNESDSVGLVTDSTKLCISNIGKAAMKGNLSISGAKLLQKDLKEAQKSLNLLTPLHLLYLVIPCDSYLNLAYSPMLFANAYQNLANDDKFTVELLGVTQGMVVSMMTGRNPRSVPVAKLKRIYGALMLRHAWECANIWEVACKFEQPRGTVQQIMTSSAAYASNVQNFCEELNEEFWCFNALLSQLSERLAHCCAVELLPLMELPAVKKGRARQLYDAGYKTLHDLSVAEPRELVNKIINMPQKVARHIISTAKMLLVERAETLREAAEDLLEGSRHDVPPVLPISPTQGRSPSQVIWRSPRLTAMSQSQQHVPPQKPYWPSHEPKVSG